MDRMDADKIGMLATVMNAIAVKDALRQQGVPAVVMTSSAMPQVADTFRSDKAIAELEAGKIVVFGGGTGNPIFSTDTASALRALEIGADAMFKATMVDGVYDKDPHKYPDAVKYDTLTFTRVLDERLAVMDSTAATLCRDNGLPIVVFDLNEPANIARALQGENVGTIVSLLVQYLKGITGRKLMEQFPQLRQKLWKGELWNHSYYVETVGDVSAETIRKYIEHQSKQY